MMYKFLESTLTECLLHNVHDVQVFREHADRVFATQCA